QWVADQWKDIAAHPYANAAFQGLIYNYILKINPYYMYPTFKLGSTGQQKLVGSFQDFIRARHVFEAKEGLDMYHAWKNDLDAKRNSRAQSQLETLFYYGTPPMDFGSVVAQVVGFSSTGAAAGIAASAANSYGASQSQKFATNFAQKLGKPLEQA